MKNDPLEGLVTDCPYCVEACKLAAALQQELRGKSQSLWARRVDADNGEPWLRLSTDSFEVRCAHCRGNRRVLTAEGQVVAALLRDAQGDARGGR